MHCPWVRKTRAWGYEVIRGIDEDDPLRVIRAFRYPTGLVFVDLNAQVEIDYGGYAWTQWMHAYFGDTALHIALKWKRHRAVKALLSLRPDWTIRNETGVTAEQLVLRMYGKGMAQLKDEQEREYENDAMRAEEEAMRSLLAAEQAARERDRLKLLQELHAARTRGVEREAAILLEHGRVILPQELVPDRDCCSDVRDGGRGQDRWVSHVCRELRRNRFAAQRGAMRRNVVPTVPPCPTTAIGGKRAGPRAWTSSFSPPPTTAGSARSGEGTTKKTTKSKKTLGSPTSSVRVSTGRRKRHAREPDAAKSDAGGSGGEKNDEQEEEEGGDLFFDSSSPVGSGHWPCADVPGRTRPVSPLGSASPLRGLRTETSSRGGGRSIASSAAGDDGASIRSGSIWGGSRTVATSPARFDRSSRMSTMRTTRILAAGRSLQRPTPEGRLQRKMAARSAARTPPTKTSPAVTAGAGPTTPPALAGPPRSPMRPAPLVVSKKNAHSIANGGSGGSIAASPGNGREAAGGRKTWAGSRRERSTVQTQGVGLDCGGRATEMAEGRKGNGPRVGVITPEPSGGGATTFASSLTDTRTCQSPCNNNTNNEVDNGESSSGPQEGPAEVSRTSRKPPDAPDLNGSGNGKNSHEGETGSSNDMEKEARHPPPQVGCAQPKDDTPRGLSPPTTPGSDGEGDPLGGVREGPVRDVLAALLTSTVMTEDGGRVLMPSFPSVSALRELKYCGPLEALQASALERVLFARPGVLVRLSLPGKRIGDGGAAAIAPALPGIRSVDLRSNNIGDDGTVAIASALREAAAAATAAAATMASKTAVSRGDGEGERGDNALCILENLSLAGNRIGDVGAAALGKLLEDEEEREREGSRKIGRGQEEETSSARSPGGLRHLGWLSVAGNPAISSDKKEHLLRAGSNRRRLRGSDRGVENDPPPMIIIV